MIAAVAAATIGAAVPRFGRRGTVVLLCGLCLAVCAAVAVRPRRRRASVGLLVAALAGARERPLLGSGAGSYFLSWREHRTVDTTVRDAHSLYVETLSELGPVGLALVLVVVAAPLCAAIRRRRRSDRGDRCRGFRRVRAARGARLGLGDACRDARRARVRRNRARRGHAIVGHEGRG